jgi:hypothetical protein
VNCCKAFGFDWKHFFIFNILSLIYGILLKTETILVIENKYWRYSIILIKSNFLNLNYLKFFSNLFCLCGKVNQNHLMQYYYWFIGILFLNFWKLKFHICSKMFWAQNIQKKWISVQIELNLKYVNCLSACMKKSEASCVYLFHFWKNVHLRK